MIESVSNASFIGCESGCWTMNNGVLAWNGHAAEGTPMDPRAGAFGSAPLPIGRSPKSFPPCACTRSSA